MHDLTELEAAADELLRDDARRECCRECGGRARATGDSVDVAQEHTTSGRRLILSFPELRCDNGHRWYAGEGRARSIGGEHPILFEEHLRDRQGHEIHTQSGTPDPGIVRGMYWRAHPDGRQLATPEQRGRKIRAGFYA